MTISCTIVVITRFQELFGTKPTDKKIPTELLHAIQASIHKKMEAEDESGFPVAVRTAPILFKFICISIQFLLT